MSQTELSKSTHPRPKYSLHYYGPVKYDYRMQIRLFVGMSYPKPNEFETQIYQDYLLYTSSLAVDLYVSYRTVCCKRCNVFPPSLFIFTV